LDAEQRVQLAALANQARQLRQRFKQRARSEAAQWEDLVRAEHFASDKAMVFVRAYGHWWDQQLSELMAQYAQLHDSLDTAQRERLVKGLKRFSAR
jgi:hypothetical protein